MSSPPFFSGVSVTRSKVQNNKQRSTKHTYKTKNRVTRTPLKHGGERRCSGRVGTDMDTD
jgi:hypothetical protein